MTEQIKFTNPRLIAEFSDWPSGGQRVKCRFIVEGQTRKGYRVSRTTTNKHGQWCRSKYTTYGDKVVIVDGSDNKTYLLQLSKIFGFISIWASDFTNPNGAAVHKDTDPAKHKELLDLIDSQYPKISI